MKILAIGDIFGSPGREAIKRLLPELVLKRHIDFVIANVENAAGGRGLTPRTADELFESPIDVMTAGNHIWEQASINPYFDSHPILRPHNVHALLPGTGFGIFSSRNGARVGVVSLQGTIFMDGKGEKASSAFCAMDKIVSENKDKCDLIIVDFHAEATSEKRALAWYLDGRIAALLGTHTHVQTCDEEILPAGTAYISDLGMTGPHASVLGLDKDVAIHRFITGQKKKFEVAKAGVRLEGALVDVNENGGKANSIERIRIVL